MYSASSTTIPEKATPSTTDTQRTRERSVPFARTFAIQNAAVIATA